jgi:hypothetical protein
MNIYLAGSDVVLPDTVDTGRRAGLTVEDFGLADNLMMIHALDLHGRALVRPSQAPADIRDDLTAFETCVRIAAGLLGSASARTLD